MKQILQETDQENCANSANDEPLVHIDMKCYIEGNNWYNAEREGRWSGPGTCSTIQLPPIPQGEFTITIKILNAITPTLVDQMRIDFCGTPVSLKKILRSDFTGRLAPFKRVYMMMFRRHRQFPVSMIGQLNVSQRNPGKSGKLTFNFPKAIPSTNREQLDSRELGVCVESITIV